MIFDDLRKRFKEDRRETPEGASQELEDAAAKLRASWEKKPSLPPAPDDDALHVGLGAATLQKAQALQAAYGNAYAASIVVQVNAQNQSLANQLAQQQLSNQALQQALNQPYIVTAIGGGGAGLGAGNGGFSNNPYTISGTSHFGGSASAIWPIGSPPKWSPEWEAAYEVAREAAAYARVVVET